MSRPLLLYSAVMLLGTFISAVSQVLLKLAANKQYDNKIREYLNPLVIIAYAIFFLATLMNIVAYKIVPLSMGPILEATSYFYVTFFGAIIFKETITGKKIFALALIIIGIVIYSVCGL